MEKVDKRDSGRLKVNRVCLVSIADGDDDHKKQRREGERESASAGFSP